MIDIKYSLIVEATDDPAFFYFYSPDLEGFTGVGSSVEDCLYKAKMGYGRTHHTAQKPENDSTEEESQPQRGVELAGRW